MSFWLDDDDGGGGDNGIGPWSSTVLSATVGATALTAASAVLNNNNSASQQQQQQQYVCENCGSTDSYHDESTNMDVCNSCYTQSQAISSQLADWDDVMGLAARTAGGRIKQQHHYGGGGMDGRRSSLNSKRKRGETGRPKQPLEELDRSVRLPNVQVCLQGIWYIVKHCVSILVASHGENNLLQPPTPGEKPRSKRNQSLSEDDNNNDDDDNNEGQPLHSSLDMDHGLTMHDRRQYAVERAAQQLWLSFLRAWADGAEFYGTRYPHVRFSFRDLFLDSIQASSLVRYHLVHQAVETTQNNLPSAAAAAAAAAAVAANGATVDDAIDKTYAMSDGDDASAPELDPDEVDDVDNDNDGNPHESDDDDGDNNNHGTHKTGMDKNPVATEATVSGRRRQYRHPIRLQAIRQIVKSDCRLRRHPIGYQEAAVCMRPNMTFVAALLYLALTKHDEVNMFPETAAVTIHDVCRWIRSGQLPLMSAFAMLSEGLQTSLGPVASFFRMDKPIHSGQLETMATNLCVACRLLIRPKAIDTTASSSSAGVKNEPLTSIVKNGQRMSVRFWSVQSLPLILAQLVSRAGLNQTLLDRSLQLSGFSLEDETATGKKHYYRRIPCVASPENLTRVEELVALIAIACQMDPQWRTWKYCRRRGLVESPDDSIPWTESQFRHLCNGPSSFESYLNFVERIVFPGDRRYSMLPADYPSACEVSLQNSEFCHSNAPCNDVNNIIHNDDRVAVPVVVQPNVVVAGNPVPLQADVSNLTFRRRIQSEQMDSRSNSGNSGGGVGRRRGATKGQGKQPPPSKTAKQKQANDEKLLVLPMHDFWQADRALANDWIPSSSSSSLSDPDEDRLLQYLSYAAGVNPDVVRQSLVRMLRHGFLS